MEFKCQCEDCKWYEETYKTEITNLTGKETFKDNITVDELIDEIIELSKKE